MHELITSVSTGGAASYYLKDHLGSVRAVVNASGTVVETRDHYPYGLEMPGRSYLSGTKAKENFTGYERDDESDLLYAGARYYMPGIGRWASVDPVTDKYPGWSPYNYVLNNPLRFVDPDGKAPCCNSVNVGLTVSGASHGIRGFANVRLSIGGNDYLRVELRGGYGGSFGKGGSATIDVGVADTSEKDQASLFILGAAGAGPAVQGSFSVPLDELGSMDNIPSPTQVLDALASGSGELSAGKGKGAGAYGIVGVQGEVSFTIIGRSRSPSEVNMELGSQSGVVRPSSTNVIRSVSTKDLERLQDL